MKKIANFLNNIEDNFCAIILAYMTITAFINVIARYVFLASLPWVEELNKVGLVILTYAGAAVALKRNAHLGLTILTDRFPPKVQNIVHIISCVCGVILCVVAIKYGYIMTANEYANNVRTQGMQWPEYLYAMWLPIGFAIIAIRFIQQIYYTVKKMLGKGETAE